MLIEEFLGLREYLLIFLLQFGILFKSFDSFRGTSVALGLVIWSFRLIKVVVVVLLMS